MKLISTMNFKNNGLSNGFSLTPEKHIDGGVWT